MTSIATSGFGSLFSNAAASFGSQANWAVDATNGNDGGAGTPAEPLRTVAELNARWHTIRFTVAPTVTFVGNCIDAPFMFNGVLAPGQGMTLNGTVTTEGTATITVVTPLGAGGNTYPYQITTTGRTWTSGDVGKRVTLPTGHVSWVQEFIDSNNVVLSQCVTSANSTTTPSVGSITIDSLSQIALPTANAMANSFAQNIAFNNFDIVNTFSIIYVNAGVNNLFFGCRFTKSTSQFVVNGPMSLRGCAFVGSSSHTIRGAAICTLSSCVFISGTLNAVSSPISLLSCSMASCPVFLTNPPVVQLSLLRFRNTANPLTLQNGGVALNLANSTIHGSTGNTGVGIRVLSGSQFQWTGASAKPTVTGATDVQIGVTSYTYTQLGTGLTDYATAAPPLVTGTPAAMFQV